MKTKDIILTICEVILKIVVLALIIAVIYKGANVAYDYGYRIFEEPPMSVGEGREVIVTIPEGMSSKEMGELLYMRGLIRDEKLFQIQYLLSEYKEDLLPGKFALRTNMTVDEMLKAMTQEPITEEE